MRVPFFTGTGLAVCIFRGLGMTRTNTMSLLVVFVLGGAAVYAQGAVRRDAAHTATLLNGEILSIDRGARTIVIRDPDDRRRELKVAATVSGLAQIRSGD